VSIWLLYFHCRRCCHRRHLIACTTVMRRHVGKSSCRHDTDTTSGKPTRCNVTDMVCVVSATWRQHVGMSVILEGKNPRHDADITSQDQRSNKHVTVEQKSDSHSYHPIAIQLILPDAKLSFRGTMPPAGSLKVLRAPAHRVGIWCAPKTKINNLETG
jgi:hypothetical protein